MQVGKGLTAPVVVEQILQMKSSQFLNLVLMPEHRVCTQFLQFRQRIEFTPVPFIHTPHGIWQMQSLIDTIFDFETSCLEHKTLAFPVFTLNPFSSGPFFQFFNPIFSSSSDPATMTRSLAYSSSYGQPVLNSQDRASIVIVKRSGLNTDPWCTLTETLIGLL